MFDDLKYAGTFRVELRDVFGNLKEVREGKNTLTNDGKDWLIAHVFDVGTTNIGFISIGGSTSAGAAAATDSATVGGRADKTGVVYGTGGTHGYGSGSATFAAAVAEAKTGITEAALWAKGSNATGSGIMFARQKFASVDKTGSDTLSITWNVQFS